MKQNYSNHIYLRSVIFFAAVFFCCHSKSQLVIQTFSYSGGLQYFTVPFNCMPTMTIEAIGAGGGSVTNSCPADGGLGASMRGSFCATPGQVLTILVGGMGQSNGADAGGGGGSFVVAQGNVPLIIGGGGGGATTNTFGCGASRDGLNASITTSGTAGANGFGAGGTGGNGGTCVIGSAGGGGGFITVGSGGNYGSSFLNGGGGGFGLSNNGGYGGGGAGWWTGGNGGGGGGYSGGGSSGASPYSGGGGGGSYNSGSNQSNTAGVQAGDGLVIISYSVGSPVPYVITPSVACSGESVTLTASGMNSYTWNTGSHSPSLTVNPPSSNAYTVTTTTTLGCITLAIVNVSINPLPIISAVCNPTALCVGSSATLTAFGASTYTWNTSLVSNSLVTSPVSKTIYTVTGTSSDGCMNFTTVSVQISTITINVPHLVESCVGSTINLTANGALTYTWSNGSPFATIPVSPVTNTFYTVNATDINNCKLTDTVRVVVHAVPVLMAQATPTAICKGEPVFLRASGAQKYYWNTGDPGDSIMIIPLLDVLYDYTVTGTDSNNCSAFTTVSVQVNACVGIAEAGVHGNSLVYPNPSQGIFSINLHEESGKTQIRIYDGLGVLIREESALAPVHKMDLSNQANGLYLVSILKNNVILNNYTVIKE
jgi:hypothetical protein